MHSIILRLIAPTIVVIALIAGCHEDDLPTGPTGTVDTVDNGMDTTGGGGDTTGGGGDTTGTTKFCFENDVLPILVSNCATSGCHDNVSREDGIDLTSYNAVMSSKNGRMVRPGNPDDSELYEVLFKSGSDQMPPPPRPRLNDAQASAIRRWIQEGAKNEDCGTTSACDTVDVTYTADIKPIMDLRCAGCHNAQTRNGAVDLSTKALVQQYASNGKLIGTMSRATGFVPMPPSGPKAPDCEIAKIQAWINGGFR